MTLVAAVALTLLIASSPSVALVNGQPRYDSAGRYMDVHAGGVFYATGRYWRVGETYTCAAGRYFWTDPNSPYCGVRIYSSTDLVTWTGPYVPFDYTTQEWQDRCVHNPNQPGAGCWRPSVVYDVSTHRYVMWLNVSGAEYVALTSSSPEGPYQLVGEPSLNDQDIPEYDGVVRPSDGDGDEGLFVDEDGTGYVVYNRGGTAIIERLSADYLNGDGKPHVIGGWPEVAPYYGVEAMSMFERQGTYYISASTPRCPYCDGTGTGIMTAPSPLGPWTYQGLISRDSCGGQPSEVDGLPGADGPIYLYRSDQWRHGGDFGTAPRLNETAALQLWAPLSFDGARIEPVKCARSYRVEPLGYLSLRGLTR